MFLKFRVIWNEKWTRNIENEALAIAIQEWGKIIQRLNPVLVNKTIEICKLTMEWPPSICEFLTIYEKEMGIPSCEDALKMACHQNFDNPFVKGLYEEIGSWSFRSDTEKELRRKFKIAYEKAIIEQRKQLIGAE